MVGAATKRSQKELARQYDLSREAVYQYLRRHAATTSEPPGVPENAVEGVN